MPGRPPLGLRCKELDHVRARCTMAFCTKCRVAGHNTADCSPRAPSYTNMVRIRPFPVIQDRDPDTDMTTTPTPAPVSTQNSFDLLADYEAGANKVKDGMNARDEMDTESTGEKHTRDSGDEECQDSPGFPSNRPNKLRQQFQPSSDTQLRKRPLAYRHGVWRFCLSRHVSGLRLFAGITHG